MHNIFSLVICDWTDTYSRWIENGLFWDSDLGVVNLNIYMESTHTNMRKIYIYIMSVIRNAQNKYEGKKNKRNAQNK